MRWERVEPSRTKSIKARALTLGAGRDRTAVLPNACGIRHISAARGFCGCTTKRWCERRVAVSRVQDSRSMRPRFRNTNLLISHVLDSCVKLLAVLHISSAQCQSVDLCRVWGERRWDETDRKKVGICIFIYTHTKTLCCILMCCTLIYTHTFFCVHPVV